MHAVRGFLLGALGSCDAATRACDIFFRIMGWQWNAIIRCLVVFCRNYGSIFKKSVSERLWCVFGKLDPSWNQLRRFRVLGSGGFVVERVFVGFKAYFGAFRFAVRGYDDGVRVAAYQCSAVLVR